MEGNASAAHVQELLRGAILATDHDERFVLIQEAGRLGVEPERDVPLFMELLDERHHWFARALAAWELLKLGPDGAAAVPLLAALAAEHDTIIDPRWAALWALERMGPAAASAAPMMLDILRDEADPDMRSEAAFALGATGIVEGVVPDLVAALEDSDSLVREEAAGALGRIGPPAAAGSPALTVLGGSDPIRPVRDEARRALRRMNEDEAAARAEAEAADAPSETDELERLLERLRSDDPRTRAESTWPVGKLGQDAAPGRTIVVAQLRHDHDPDARWGASWCAGRIGPAAADQADEVAAAVREDPDPDVRAQAAHALGRIGHASPDVLETLAGALDDGGASLLREEALTALGRLGAPARVAVPAIRARLADPHRLVREKARGALVALLDDF